MDCEIFDDIALDLLDSPESTAFARAPSSARADASARPGRADSAEPGDAESRRLRRDAEDHLVGCERCRAMLARLREGKRAARALERQEPSALLESRILAAVARSSPPPSRRVRFERALSSAGAWAMRPQVAMAAVLVLMVGTSVALLRSGPSSRTPKVTEEGTPVARLEAPAPPEGAPATIERGSEDDRDGERAKTEAKGAAAAPSAGAPLEDGLASKDMPRAEPIAEGRAKSAGPPADDLGDLGATLGGGAAPKPAPVAAAPGKVAGPAATAAPASPETATDQSAPSKAAKKTDSSGEQASRFEVARTAYDAGRYAEAAAGFEAAAAAGERPATSLLYAARAHRAASGCAAALPRYQRVVKEFPKSPEAPVAALEGGRCAKAQGDAVAARSLLERAKGAPATRPAAEAELAAPPVQAAPAAPPVGKAAAPAKPSAPTSAADQ